VSTEQTPIQRLSTDLARAASSLTTREARYLVDSYYAIQEYRKAANNQTRAMQGDGEPHAVVQWLGQQMTGLEAQIKRALEKWTDANPVGEWAKSICGIGPVISAGLLAHIDISKAPTVGHIWRFAGLDPTVTWERKQKRPWNASLKTLCWKIGESFVKVSGNPNDVYGKLWLKRKEEEMARNEAGDYQEIAKLVLASKNIGKKTEAYKHYEIGKLPPAHIHARAKRWAVKLFLSHYHHVAFETEFGYPPPKPFALEHLGHAHFVPIPNWQPYSQRENQSDGASHLL